MNKYYLNELCNNHLISRCISLKPAMQNMQKGYSSDYKKCKHVLKYNS